MLGCGIIDQPDSDTAIFRTTGTMQSYKKARPAWWPASIGFYGSLLTQDAG
jgi:hypothetical protein